MLYFISAVVACVSGLAIMDKEMSRAKGSLCLDMVFAFSLAYFLCKGAIM